MNQKLASDIARARAVLGSMPVPAFKTGYITAFMPGYVLTMQSILDAFVGAYDPQPKMLQVALGNHSDPNLGYCIGITYVKIRITGLSYESGAPGMFLLNGFIEVMTTEKNLSWKPFEGFYDVNHEVGHITY